MSEDLPKTQISTKREPLTELVQCKADTALVLDFDQEVARLRKTRSEVIRELILVWVDRQQKNRLSA